MTPPERARAFLTALANMAARLDEKAPARPVDTAWRVATSRADCQIAERAATEAAFRGSLMNAEACVRRLLAALDGWANVPTPTTDVLRVSVECLGFGVVSSDVVRFTVADVDGIYSTTASTVQFDDVRAELIKYLVGEQALVWTLAGRQHPAVLQWWKTFARHVLIDRAPGTYLLRNLVHVCEGADEAYVVGLIARSGHR